MSDASTELTWRRSSQVAFVDDGERIVLMDLQSARTSRPQLLTGSAAAIWRAIDRARTTQQVASSVADRFNTAPEAVLRDVNDFLGHLRRQGLAMLTETD